MGHSLTIQAVSTCMQQVSSFPSSVMKQKYSIQLGKFQEVVAKIFCTGMLL